MTALKFTTTKAITFDAGNPTVVVAPGETLAFTAPLGLVVDHLDGTSTTIDTTAGANLAILLANVWPPAVFGQTSTTSVAYTLNKALTSSPP